MVQGEEVAGACESRLLVGCEVRHPGDRCSHCGRVVAQIDWVSVDAHHEVKMLGCRCLQTDTR